MLRKLNDNYQALIDKEELSREFHAAVGEDVESVRPAYDYSAVQAQLDTIQAQVRRIKHAINVFNTTHIVPGYDMTVDERLVHIPQLTKKKEKLFFLTCLKSMWKTAKKRVFGSLIRLHVCLLISWPLRLETFKE